MGAKAYIGIDGIARRAKKMYIGVDGVARKVKKAYIGVGGVARKAFGSDLEYVGTAENLSQVKYNLAATTVGDYALFGGGQYQSNGTATCVTVDAYDKSLTRMTATDLSKARYGLKATTVGDYALFGGGWYSSSSYGSTQSVVDAYNTSLTRTTPTALGASSTALAATTVGDYALFGGGYYTTSDMSYTTYQSTVTAYDKSLTRTTPTALSTAREYLAGATVGDYALFGGGFCHPIQSKVDAYDRSLTRTTATDLSTKRQSMATTTIGDYALFGGGQFYVESSSECYNQSTVDAYDKSLTKTTATSLSVARRSLKATTVGDYALFGGGHSGNGGTVAGSSSIVDAYDKSLTKTTATSLSVARQSFEATTVGDYALFGGGSSSSPTAYWATVDVYEA